MKKKYYGISIFAKLIYKQIYLILISKLMLILFHTDVT